MGSSHSYLVNLDVAHNALYDALESGNVDALEKIMANPTPA